MKRNASSGLCCGFRRARHCIVRNGYVTLRAEIHEADHNRAVNVDVAPPSASSCKVSRAPIRLAIAADEQRRLAVRRCEADQAKAEPGAAQTTQLWFRAVRPGESVLQLHYARPWEKAKPPLQEFSVRCRVTPRKLKTETPPARDARPSARALRLQLVALARQLRDVDRLARHLLGLTREYVIDAPGRPTKTSC